MPSKASGRPSASTKRDNNYYLKKLVVIYSQGGKDIKKRLIKSDSLNYKKSFTVKVPKSVKSVKIKAVQACKASSEKKGSTVSGSGKKSLKAGKNVFKVKCKASTGTVRTYTVTVVRG